MSAADASRLALGTVQFGLNYGVANATGQVTLQEGRRILDTAAEAGMDTLDTAVAYGASEEVLGKLGVQSWRVITKLPPMPTSVADVQTWVLEQVAGSRTRLGLNRLGGVLMHRTEDLIRHPGLVTALLRLKADGVIDKIGVSIYDPQELDAVHTLLPLDIVQSPLNVFDRRIVDSGWARRLREGGTELHTRSTFLQGLLLMTASQRPAHFNRWAEIWSSWDRWLAEVALEPLEACLGFVLQQAEVSRVVVGVDHAEHLTAIIQASHLDVHRAPDFGASADPDLIHPGRWSAASSS